LFRWFPDEADTGEGLEGTGLVAGIHGGGKRQVRSEFPPEHPQQTDLEVVRGKPAEIARHTRSRLRDPEPSGRFLFRKMRDTEVGFQGVQRVGTSHERSGDIDGIPAIADSGVSVDSGTQGHTHEGNIQSSVHPLETTATGDGRRVVPCRLQCQAGSTEPESAHIRRIGGMGVQRGGAGHRGKETCRNRHCSCYVVRAQGKPEIAFVAGVPLE
jgi:hypothetical protein